MAELQHANLKLASRTSLPADPPKPAVARKHAAGKKSNGPAKKPMASKQKRKPKGAGAVLLQEDLSGEVLRGQQQVMGDLSQVTFAVCAPDPMLPNSCYVCSLPIM